jgi:uncharacterized protein YodC (DUF2158 family)
LADEEQGLMSSFKAGDVVELKSGGPAMTVSHERSSAELFCEWFDVNGKYQSQDFQPESLKLYEPPTLAF